MNSTDFADIPSVRLASGVEMQQRWASVQNPSEQKTDKAPRLIEITPTKGDQGTIITVVVQSLPQQLVPVKLAFNSLVVDTKQMQAQGITSLVASVPPFQHTHSTLPNVPISICILDRDSVTETWPVAEFTYEFDQKKVEPSIIKFTPTEKRNDVSTTSFQSGADNFLASSATVYENFYNQSVNPSLYSGLPQYAYNQGRQIYNENNYRSNNLSQASVPESMSSLSYNDTANLNLFNSNSTSFTGMLNGFESDASSTLSPQTPSAVTYSQAAQMMSQAAAVAAVTTPAQSQRQSNSNQYGYGKTSAHVPATSVANYQPYPGLVSRANLKLMGDLDTMSKSWTPEEWENRRRLVQFWREQTGSEIRCTFSPISQGERITSNSGHIVVSCIYWAERDDCFITSVDCIHLLESLMDIRFSVEEKNRVRRNLEGFRPLTVSKCKPESADFFKLIMGFPNPKPRNIEKDVKVFPWKTLPYALKKIITKYTASTYNGNSSLRQHHPQLLKGSNNNSLPTTPVVPASHTASSYFNTPTMLSAENLNPFYQQHSMYVNGIVNQQQAFPYQNNSNVTNSVYQESSPMTNFSSTYNNNSSTTVNSGNSESNCTDQLNNSPSSPRAQCDTSSPSSFGLSNDMINTSTSPDGSSNFEDNQSSSESSNNNISTPLEENNNLDDQEYQHVFADFKSEN